MGEGLRIRAPRVGDWVEVRSPQEIMRTLDAKGELDRMPFMPEMLKHAGRRFRISAVAHKTCDTVNKTGGRAVRNVVHLEDLRCDGGAHGGCQATCLLFWKSAWLRPAPGPQSEVERSDREQGDADEAAEALTVNACHIRSDGVPIYRCQATTLPEWSGPLKWWDVRQYWRDVSTGNVTAGRAASTLFLAAIYNLRRLPAGYRVWCWVYEQMHQLVRGRRDPHGTGSIQRGAPTPDLRLDLKPGETVEIRSKEDIYGTVNHQNKNRGLQVDEEMTRYCGGQFQVKSRVTQIINEATGEMTHFSNPCVVLDGVECIGDYADRRLLCPRRITAYWREIWLTRVTEPGDAAPAAREPAGNP